MVRFKNAITGYFVSDWDNATPPLPAAINLELANWISSVTDDTDETVDSTAYYDGDGTLEDDLTAIKKTYTFTGLYDAADPAMAFIATKELTIGQARKIGFRQVRTDGSQLWGRGTVTAIKVTGGDASDYAPFECVISWDQIPTVIPAPAPGP